MAQQFVNCPTNKLIHEHFQDQLTQLNINPRTEQDHKELMTILNSYLSYPDDQLANHHRLANKLGILDVEAQIRQEIAASHGMDKETQNNMKQTKIFKLHTNTCHCCGFFVQPDDISACSTPAKSIKNLGVANMVFFQTFCYLSILLIAMILIYSIFAFATNISVARSTNYVSLSGGTVDYLSISLGAKTLIVANPNNDGQNYYLISSWLGFVMLIVWAIVLGCIRKDIAMIEHNHKRKLRMSDFSIVIENIPTDFTKQEIQENFDRYLKGMLDDDVDKWITLKKLDVVTYNQGKPFYLDQKEFGDQELSRLLKEHEDIKEKIADYVVQYRKYGKFQTPRGERTYNYTKYQENQIKKKQKYREIVAKMRQRLQAKSDASRTVAFVTFATHEQRNFILDNNKNSLFYKLKRKLQFWKDSDYFSLRKGDNIYDDLYIETPPEPEDINWGNLGMTNCQKFLRMCLTLFVSLILVGISLLVVYGLSQVQVQNKNQRFISILISLAISLFNLLIVKVIQFMTVFEKGYSMNNYQISIAIKSVVVQLINSIAVPILVNYYIKNVDNNNFYGQSGLVEDIFILALASSFIPPLIKLIDPWNLLLILRFKWYHDQERRLFLNQFELNQISERMEFQIGLEYIYLIHNFIFTCFFVSLQPIIPLFAVIALFLMFWIEKYALYARCQRPVPGPDTITSKLYQLIFFGAVAFALGNLTWSWFLPDSNFRRALVPNLISLGLALVIFIFPYEKLVSSEAIREEKNYYQKRIYFPSEYDRLNPMTSRKAIEQYRIFLLKKKNELQGNDALQAQLMQGFQNLSQNNIYKPNYFGRLSADDQSLVIQQLFYNQSRNVIDPQLLYQAIMPRHQSMQEPPPPPMVNQNELYPSLQGVNSAPPKNQGNIGRPIGRSGIYQQSSRDFIRDPNNLDPANIFSDDINNVYRSNFRLDNNFNFKMVESKMVPERRPPPK